MQVRRALHNPIFGRRVQLWEIIQDLGSNSVKRFHMEKRLRSNEIGQQGCYFIRRLASNLGKPQRSYATNAIDRALTFWKAKRVRKPVPLRAPWLLAHIGLVTSGNFSLLTFTLPNSTTPPSKHHPPALSTPNILQSWTAYAITKKQPPGGPMGKLQYVHVLLSANTQIYPVLKINILSWMETNYALTTPHSPPLLQDHFRTKSFQHPKKSTSPYVPH